MFTLDTESGFREVVFITSSYGLGETVVQGSVNPDEFYLFKNSLSNGKYPILKKALGSKLIQMRFAGSGKSSGVETTEVPTEMRNMFSITEQEAIELAQYALIIERHYGRPMDIEWGKDGLDGKIYILQARPETVKSSGSVKKRQRYKIKVDANDRKILSTGRAIGQKVGSGPVKMLQDISEIDKLEKGDVLVTDMTDPNWESVMKRASAIVTNRGGRTCHAAIIARELGVPAVVGCGDATKVLQNGTDVTVSCAEGDEGYVYQGVLDTEVTNIEVGALKKLPLKIMMNLGNPQLAFEYSQIPNDGIGLARLEFIINNNVGIHPQAILDYPNVSGNIKTEIEKKVIGYESPNKFYTGKLIEGISTIAAAFHPKPVIVRLSDFKSNEYKKLIGGVEYEPDEENPMLGFRGVSRYLSRQFHDAFSMECEALRFVRNEMGLENVEVMVPFVRTLSQAEKVISLLDSQGLKRGENGLRIIMMCEVPSNAILANEFLEYFDGFSIGSNDLTQLSLGLDRDSGDEILAADFKESDLTVKKLITQAIEACFSENKYVGICGQGPSDDPEFARWLMDKGISSLSLNPDTIIDTWKRLEQ
jgi:pyruvate,water dikinase